MDYFLIILAVLLMLTGTVGCFLPAIPGPPLCFAGLVLAHISRFAEFEITTLAVLGGLTLAVLVLDYAVPAWGVKKYGGTKYGTWGSVIGLIIGTFFISVGPLGIVGILGGPFLGAYAGEIIGGKKSQDALKAAFGSFVGFVAGTFMKLALALAMIAILVQGMA